MTKRVLFPMFEIHSDISIGLNKNGSPDKIKHSKPVIHPHNFHLKDPEFISNAYVCADCGLEALEVYEGLSKKTVMKSFDAEKKCVKDIDEPTSSDSNTRQ
jgi:hypothetical protein